MSRFRHTIALALTTVAISATAALAAPDDPGATLPDGTSTMAAEMYDTCPMAAGVHGTSAMASMHVGDHDHHADHAGMAGAPEMAHMARFGLDHAEMMGWMADGVSPAEMHARLEARGVDLDELLRTCPHGAAMTDPSTMHGRGTAGLPTVHTDGTGPDHDAHHGS
jgi:hypothetical protein